MGRHVLAFVLKRTIVKMRRASYLYVIAEEIKIRRLFIYLFIVYLTTYWPNQRNAYLRNR